jgi:hypothetical protein
MQVLNIAGFEKRILHNAAKEYATQLLRGEDYNLLNPVIALTFTDFSMFEGSPEAISRFRLLERKHFIEMPVAWNTSRTPSPVCPVSRKLSA